MWRRDVHCKELAIEYDAEGGTRTRPLSHEEALRPTLDEREVMAVAALGLRIEEHYGSPQDTEWAFDPDGKLWMLQSRPITTLHDGDEQASAPSAGEASSEQPQTVLLRGLGGAPGSASGAARVLTSLADAAELGDGDVLVTHMTSPDWLPLLRRAAGVVTDSGGMTCHAAIVSRELGIPCVVGTGEATSKLRDGEIVTVDATRGLILEGALAPEPARAPSGGEQATKVSLGASSAAAVTATQILVNLSEPSQVQRVKDLPVDGVGLLRAEMMVLEALAGDHPRTLLEEGRGEEFVSRMAEGLSAFATGFAPRPVTYRTIDFRTNEFAGLRGGERFEPKEANPMIGYRGALRYTREPDVFALELEAVRRVWDAGQRNLHVMLPFVRTARELRRCRDLIAESGLLDRPGFELWVMAEVPSVLFNLAEYAALGVSGISIGSNDLTQLLLGADRDNEVLAETFDERDPAVTTYLRELIPRARGLGLRTSICGQAPSVHPEYAELLVRAGIDAISVNVDVIDRTRALVAAAEQRVMLDFARAHDTAAERAAGPGARLGPVMLQVRIHGRGGQGVVTAAELLSLAAFDEGRYAQAFPSFGSERMGAPVVSFCRIDDREIRVREPVMEPDVLIVVDPTLLHQVDVFGGLTPDGFILINTTRSFDELGLGEFVAGLPSRAAVDRARRRAGTRTRWAAGRQRRAARRFRGAQRAGLARRRCRRRSVSASPGTVGEGNVAAAMAAYAWVADELQGAERCCVRLRARGRSRRRWRCAGRRSSAPTRSRRRRTSSRTSPSW